MSLLCPLLKKECIEHKCAWFTHVTGIHPQTGKDLDLWDCSVRWLPVMITEQARQTRGVCASVDSMRNEVVKRQDELNTAVLEKRNEAPRIVDIPDRDLIGSTGSSVER
jgi:hypothetical protein